MAAPTVTPAELALELGLSPKRVREVLRERYGTLGSGQTRWQLEPEHENYVRERVRGESGPLTDWTLDVGEQVRRRSIHEAYGGQRQGGISTPKSIPDIFVFTDPISGARHGYDRFEGLREDGGYSYTGEGQAGPQEFVRGNLALRDSAANGRLIRLFVTSGTLATYVGAFTTGEPTYWIETIPDTRGNPRDGIIFNLIPVEADQGLLPAYGGAPPLTEARTQPWYPPDYSDVVVASRELGLTGDRVVTRLEFLLQRDFGEWLGESGSEVERLSLPVGKAAIEPDLYVRDRGWIVEAKRSSGREFVRTAIGQVLDYVHLAGKSGFKVRPVILLPGRPDEGLVELIADLRIVLAVRSESGFEIIEPELRS